MFHVLDVKVGYSCNNRCRFCVQGDKRGRFPDRSREEIRRILETRKGNSTRVIFTGGEVTIRKDFFGLVRDARKAGYEEVVIQTNGRMLAYEEFCKKAIEAGATSFGPAIHGSTAEIHDNLTRAPGSFDQTLQGIKNLVKLKQYVSINTVVNKLNYKDLPDLARLLVSVGVNQFQFAFIHINQQIRSDPSLIKEIVPRKSAVIKYVKQGLQIGLDHKIKVMAEAIPLCLMKGYEQCVAEQYIPHASVQGIRFIEDFDKSRKEEGKAKGPPCVNCDCYSECEGPWREYPEIFGWEEFKTVKKNERAGCKARLCL